MYGEIFTGHLSKYSKCFRRRTVCEKNEGQKCRSVLYRKVFCNEALWKNAASQCAKRFSEDSAARTVLSGYSGRISGYKNSPVLKNPELWKKSLQKNVFFIRSLPIPLPTLKSGRTSGLLALQQRRERLVNQKGQNGDQQTLHQGEGQIEHDEGQKQLVAEGEKPVISAHQSFPISAEKQFDIEGIYNEIVCG